MHSFSSSFFTAEDPNSSELRYTEAYKPGPAAHPEVSPLLAESLARLPAAVIQVAGADSLRDDGLCYAERLEEDGVLVKLHVSVPSHFPDRLRAT